MRDDALKIINEALKASDPYKNVADALSKRKYSNNITLISAGKAACTMAKAAYDILENRINKGFIITKYNHSIPMPDIFEVYEAGHPLPDKNTVKYTSVIVDSAKKLRETDKIVFLLSGGASALFELPKVELKTLIEVTDMLLRCGADITEINIIRKKLSAVKGGKFAKMCKCSIDCFILSDVLGDKIEMIASGPCCSDNSNVQDIANIFKKYSLDFSFDIGICQAQKLLFAAEATTVTNAENYIIGSISMLCDGAKKCAEKLGYEVQIVTLSMTGEASETGRKIARDAIDFASKPHKKTAFIYGGETTVTVNGNGKGGRNQEIALAAAIELQNNDDILIFSLGSDGTDGPTDAAGGIVDGKSYSQISAVGISPEEYLADNDSYNALEKTGSLIKTGPTGTNVNDITVVLVQ